MSFLSVLQQDNVGHAFLLDVSFDNFATVSYRWSTISCTVGGNDYEARIAERGISRIARAFGHENTPTAGVVTVSLENTDFAADWLVDRATVASQVFKARFKLTLVVYPAFSTPGASGQTQVWGTFKCITFPARDRERVSVQLSDDTMGLLDAPLVSPTIREWTTAAGSTTINCPIVASFAPAPTADSNWDQPLPLVFGSGRLNCFCAANEIGIEGGGNSAAFTGRRVIPVCATVNTDAVTLHDVEFLWGVYGPDVMLGGEKWGGAGSTLGIPRTFTVPDNISAALKQDQNLTPGATYTIWSPQKTQSIAKDGATWQILWVDFNVSRYSQWFVLTRPVSAGGPQLDHVIDAGVVVTGDVQNNAPVAFLVPTAPNSSGGYSKSGAQMAAFAYFQVSGFPFSAITTKTSYEQLGVNVVQDLIAYYSHGSIANVDTARLAKALAMSPVPVCGVLQPQRPLTTRFKYSNVQPGSNALSNGQLRQAISDICQSADLDYAMTWSGQVAVYSSYFSFADITTARVSLDETRCFDVTEKTPSKGERWSPYNRVFTVAPDGSVHGPFDNPDPNVTWGVVLERTIQGKWGYPFSPVSPLYTQTVWSSLRRLESVVRPVIHFSTDREGLQLDLGDLFNFTWTRGGSAGPYQTSAVFRVESMTVDPALLVTTIEAVWVDDITTTHPYLLDDERFLLRVTGSAARTITVTDGTRDLPLSSGDLTADGVAAGDVLVLKDSSQALNVFTRNRCLRISSVLTPTLVRVVDSDSTSWDFGSPGGIAVSEWEIRRGQQTYPTSSTDPTNYPNDGTMYGKACDNADVYPDATAANVLI